jgi:hypothetical protein
MLFGVVVDRGEKVSPQRDLAQTLVLRVETVIV